MSSSHSVFKAFRPSSFLSPAPYAEFTGALAEPTVRKWIEKHLPGMVSSLLQDAIQLFNSGQFAAASVLQSALREEPQNARVRVRLAQAQALSKIDQTVDSLEDIIIEPDLVPIAKAIHTLVHYAKLNPGTLPDGKGRPFFKDTLDNLKDKNYNGGLDHLITGLQHDRYYHDDAARKLGVAIFTLPGPQHVTTIRYRRTFDMWLY